jgi:hypothetical protein
MASTGDSSSWGDSALTVAGTAPSASLRATIRTSASARIASAASVAGKLTLVLALVGQLTAAPVVWENYLDDEGPESHGYSLAPCGATVSADGTHLFMADGPVRVKAVSGAGTPSLVVFDRDMTTILASGTETIAHESTETVVIGIDGPNFHATFECRADS